MIELWEGAIEEATEFYKKGQDLKDEEQGTEKDFAGDNNGECRLGKKIQRRDIEKEAGCGIHWQDELGGVFIKNETYRGRDRSKEE
jgi:hypothetical protein